MQFIINLTIGLLLVPGLAVSGSIKGKTMFSGETPPLTPFKTGKYEKACGPEVQNETLIINNKRLKNVVLSLHSKNLEPKAGEYHLDQKKCRYVPHVIAVPINAELKIRTSDPVNHNIHTYSFDNDPINIMFIPGQEEYIQELEEAEIIKVECDLHSWMTAWVVVTPNSYSAVSDSSGFYEISNVPPGNYKLAAWHETLGSLNKNITIKNKDINVNFNFLDTTP